MVRAWSVAMGTAAFNQQVVQPVAMLLPSRFQCFWSLFWFCACFPPQKGGGLVRGYPVGNEVSSHAVVFDPPPSERLYPGGSFGAGTRPSVATIQPGNQMKVASSHVQHEDSDDASSGMDPGDQIRPENKSSKHEQSTYLHPLPLLVKQTQRETIEGLSFPTVQHFKQFVELMKNSYLTPGKNVSRFFQTARAVMENELTLGARGPTTDHRPHSSEENSDQDQTWSESTNSVENEPDVHFQEPRVPDSAPSAAGSGWDENQAWALSTLAQVAADGPVPAGLGWTEAGGLPAGLQAAAGETPPGGPRRTEQMPSGWFGGDFASAEALISPAHGATPDLDPQASEGMSQESDSEDSFKYENPSGGFQLGGFQKEAVPERIPADVLYWPKASPPVGRWNKGNVSGGVPKDRDSLSSSSQTHQPTAGEEEWKGSSRSIVHPPESGSSASSKATLGPQGRRGQAGDPSGSPHVLGYKASRRQPLRSQHVEPNAILGEPRQTRGPVQALGPGGPGSAQWWSSSPHEVDHGLHFLTKLAWPSDSDTIFRRKTGQKENSRNSKMKHTMVSDDPNEPSSFFDPGKRSVTLKGGFEGPAEAAIPHTSIQDTVYRPPQPVHASRSASAAVQSGAGKGPFYLTADSFPLPFYTTKTTSNYFRSKVSFSKIHYAPL